MKGVAIGVAVAALLVALVAAGWGNKNGAAAQDSDEDLAATVEALQTHVADLEDRVAALEAAVGSEPGEENGSARATRTPASCTASTCRTRASGSTSPVPTARSSAAASNTS